MSPKRSKPRRSRSCFPRVSGDEPGWLALAESLDPFSPHERG